MSNGILRDPRTFFMADPKAWIEMYDRQGTSYAIIEYVDPDPGVSHFRKFRPQRLAPWWSQEGKKGSA
jgi:hypothetical protein